MSDTITTFDARVYAIHKTYLQKLVNCFTNPHPLVGFSNWMTVLTTLRQVWQDVADEMKNAVLTILEDWVADL
jgi:hypothetical protein